MSEQHEVTTVTECRWVRMPYTRVARLIREDPVGLFGPNRASEERSVYVDLTAHVSPGFSLGAEAEVTVGTTEETPGPIPSIRVPLAWHATHREELYPVMHATLEAFPTTPNDTELAIVGEYVPPLGALGSFIDHTVMHKIASDVIVDLLEAIVLELKNRRPADDVDSGSARTS